MINAINAINAIIVINLILSVVLTQATAAPNILFLCTGNYYRSRMAEAVFNFEAKKAGLTWSAKSKGLRTNLLSEEEKNTKISPLTANALKKLNIPPTNPPNAPTQVTRQDMNEATYIIAMSEDEHRPFIESDYGTGFKVEYWKVEDIEKTDPKEALKTIAKRTQALVRQIKRNVFKSSPNSSR